MAKFVKKDPALYYSKGEICLFLAGVVGLLIAVIVCAIAIRDLPQSGPNCPNMDPSWLGWCEVSQ